MENSQIIFFTNLESQLGISRNYLLDLLDIKISESKKLYKFSRNNLLKDKKGKRFIYLSKVIQEALISKINKEELLSFILEPLCPSNKESESVISLINYSDSFYSIKKRLPFFIENFENS